MTPTGRNLFIPDWIYSRSIYAYLFALGPVILFTFSPSVQSHLTHKLRQWLYSPRPHFILGQCFHIDSFRMFLVPPSAQSRVISEAKPGWSSLLALYFHEDSISVFSINPHKYAETACRFSWSPVFSRQDKPFAEFCFFFFLMIHVPWNYLSIFGFLLCLHFALFSLPYGPF